MVSGVISDISMENKDVTETVVSRAYVWPFWGSDGAPDRQE